MPQTEHSPATGVLTHCVDKRTISGTLFVGPFATEVDFAYARTHLQMTAGSFAKTHYDLILGCLVHYGGEIASPRDEPNSL